MRKKTRIQNIEIDANREINAFDTDGSRVKLTRHQRSIFANYRNPEFIDEILKEFGALVIAPDFYVEKDGEIVYTRN